MPEFTYRAKNGPDEMLEGTIKAENRETAVSQLLKKGITPVKVELTGFPDIEPRPSAIRRFGKVRPADIDIFTRQLASLIRSGIVLIKALGIIKEQTENSHFRGLISNIEASVEGGKMLSDALSRYPKLFPSIYVNMIKAGETGGVLDEALERLVEFREKEEGIRAKISSALTYPVFLTVAGILTVFVMFTFFMPRLMDLFEQLGQVLPLPTRILISISSFAEGNWIWVVLGFFVLILLFKRKNASKSGRLAVDWFKLRIPVMGGLIKKAEISKFARALAVLLKSGISLFKAIEVAAHLVNSEVFKGELNNMKEGIISGSSLTDSMKSVSQFSPFAVNIIAVGEEGGRLEESLLEVADFYEKDADRTIKVITSLIEPVIIMFIGAIVGLIVFAMLLPIFNMDMAV